MWVVIQSSKTSPRPHKLQLDARPDMELCPVSAMRAFLNVRPQGADQLFIDALGAAITTARLSAMLKVTARLCGLCPTGISGHCLRISGATHGALKGMSELQLAEAGRWRSRAVRRYVRGRVSVLNVA